MSDTLTCEDYYPETDAKGETDKHRHLVKAYTVGNGVDLGSAGCPVVPWAIQVDLPQEQYHIYNQTRPKADIHWRGSALDLPFKDQTLDWVHSAHLLEDFLDWIPVLKEWDRVLKPEGFMIISLPDHQRFRAYVQRGKDRGEDWDNMSHVHESYVGELTSIFMTYFAYEVLMDRFVSNDLSEYSIIFVARKIV